MPAFGSLAATFQSRPIYPPLLALATLTVPLFIAPPLGRIIRRIGRRVVKQDAATLAIAVEIWHHYEINWDSEGVSFRIDNQVIYQTTTPPFGPLGLVIWIDNQYAAFPPDGRLHYGTLANIEPAWIEIDHLVISRELVSE